jgi:ATP-dependent DNA ligase
MELEFFGTEALFSLEKENLSSRHPSLPNLFPISPSTANYGNMLQVTRVNCNRTQYGLYQQAVGLLHTKKEEKWKNAKLAVFDVDIDSPKVYEERMKLLDNMGMPEHVIKVMPIECKGKEHLWKYFDEIIKKNGEGVMLRMPHSIYERGRSDTLKKFKVMSTW